MEGTLSVVSSLGEGASFIIEMPAEIDIMNGQEK